MENTDNHFQLALEAADQKIEAIDSEHHTLQSTLSKLISDRAVLLSTRKALLIQLGELTPETHTTAEGNSARSKNHFKGMGQAAAARKHLTEVGHSQTHAEVLEALLKGNFKTHSKRPSDSLRMAMQKRPDWFRWVKRPGDHGRWELVEWPTEDGPNTTPPSSNSEPPTLSLVQ